MEEHGGHVLHAFPPSIFIGSIPESVVATLRARFPDGRGMLGHIRDAATARFELSTRAGLTPPERAALRFLLPRTIPEREDEIRRILPDEAIETPPASATMAPIGGSFYNTSEFLAGDIAVGIVRPESNGVSEAQTENWTGAEVTTTLTELLSGLTKLANRAPLGKATFVYRTESFGSGVAGTVESDYEAILHPNFDNTVVLNVLGKLGYSMASGFDRRHEWVNDLRSDFGTDWAYGFFIVDNNVAGGTGTASANINGPTVWIFANNTASVYYHESGHSWGARDEYSSAGISPTSLHGYNQEVNANSQANDGTGFFSGAGEAIDAVMINNIDYMSPWTRGQIGIWDLDNDGIYDPQDTFAGVTLNAPTGSGPLTFTGAASAVVLRRETGSFAVEDACINRITRVEWRINAGPWQDATPSDGSFNTPVENFTFTTPVLRNGGVVVEARATDHFGNTTQLYARSDATISGSALVNTPPLAALSVTPSLGSTATSFQFSAAGSTDPEEGTASLQYRFDFENDSVYDTAFSSSSAAAHVYPGAGSYTAKVEVMDRQGLTTTRTVSLTVSAANVAPTPALAITEGHIFASSPIVFNFSAAGVSDGEDSASALEVRWDFEDDGIWDIAYSTTKTTSHDYAMDFAKNPVQEIGSTGLYSSCNVNGLAQSFVAQTTSIGKAELYLRFNTSTGACPNSTGTVTVGIRSSLTGAFLTSVTRNQSEIISNDYNIFDFSDVAVTNGSTYYLVLISSDFDLMWVASGANPYADGSHNYSFNGGSSWTQNTTYDHRFRIVDVNLSVTPLAKSKVWRVRMEVRDSNSQTAQTVRDLVANGYDTAPTVSLASVPTSGTVATTYALTAIGSDANSAATWDGLLHYRWDVDNNGNFETEFDTTNTRNATYTRSGIYQATVEARDRLSCAGQRRRNHQCSADADFDPPCRPFLGFHRYHG